MSANKITFPLGSLWALWFLVIFVFLSYLFLEKWVTTNTNLPVGRQGLHKEHKVIEFELFQITSSIVFLLKFLNSAKLINNINKYITASLKL